MQFFDAFRIMFRFFDFEVNSEVKICIRLDYWNDEAIKQLALILYFDPIGDEMRKKTMKIEVEGGLDLTVAYLSSFAIFSNKRFMPLFTATKLSGILSWL